MLSPEGKDFFAYIVLFIMFGGITWTIIAAQAAKDNYNKNKENWIFVIVFILILVIIGAIGANLEN